MKISKTICTAILPLLALSCGKIQPAGEQEGSCHIQLQAVMGEQTKASVTSEGVSSWTSGDAIAVYTSKNKIRQMALTSIESGVGYFSGNFDEGETPQTIAVFPNTALSSVSGNTITVTYPTTYTYSENALYAPMAATVDGSTLAFKNLGGLLSIPCDEVPAQAKKFFVAAYHCKMTGNFSISIANGMKAQAESSGSNSKVTVNFINDGTAKTFIIPVPAGTYECIYAAFEDENGKKIKEWEVLTDATIERGDMFVRSMPSSMLRVATYNISFSYNESSHTWNSERKANTLAAMPTRYIDLMGSQENTTGQVSDILGVMPGYSVIGRCNHGNALTVLGYSNNVYESCAIYLKESRLAVLESGTFWYSDTPDEPSRRSSDFNMRCCNWAKMKLDGEKVFYIFNTHLQVDDNNTAPDDKYRQQRRYQATMLVDRIKALGNEYPVIVTGDMNPSVSPIEGGEATDYFVSEGGLRETRALLKAPHGPSGSLNYYNYDPEKDYTRRTDFVYVNDKVNVHSLWIDNSKKGDGNWESDHFPVIVDISLK